MSSNCDKHLTSGTKLMGSNVATGNFRSLVVTRGSDIVINGGAYVPGETLTVTLTPTDTQFAFEILSGDATFVDGSCSSKRIANTVATFTMPASGDVQVVAGSASQHGAVSLTETFTLTAPVVETTIGLATIMPVLPIVTPVVGIVVTESPSTEPTTFTPTVSPSSVVTELPSTEAPSAAPVNPITSTPPSTQASLTPQQTSLSVVPSSTSPEAATTIAPSVIPSSALLPSVTPSEAPTDFPS
eukprot:gene45756-57016_t